MEKKDTKNMSPEELREYIVELDEENESLTKERDTLSENNKKLNSDLERVRSVNQRYFEKLTARNITPEGETNKEDQEAPSCEEFARGLKF